MLDPSLLSANFVLCHKWTLHKEPERTFYKTVENIEKVGNTETDKQIRRQSAERHIKVEQTNSILFV